VVQAVFQRAAAASQIVLSLDLDGALIPFAPTPQEARIEGAAAALREELGTLPSVTLGAPAGGAPSRRLGRLGRLGRLEPHLPRLTEDVM
jgi:hypothetical protein